MMFWASSAWAAERSDPNGIEFFESRIRPILVEHCYECHDGRASPLQGGLRLDTRAGIRQGGDSGQAVVPGNPDESLLMGALRHEDYEMPPSGQLPDRVIADFEAWVRMGAPDPRREPRQPDAVDLEQGRQFWAFQTPRPVPAPHVERESWPRSDIDRFVLAGLEAAGLETVDDADRVTLIRRVTLDLTGLPPAAEEVDAFLGDHSPQAWQRVVDRLLQSREFGPRWGRHWLDVARYAESTGRTRNYPFPFAWRYRDYVIDAFNEDKPFDEFIIQQLAGDLVPYASEGERRENLIATGFLALGSHDLNERDSKVFRMDVVAEQIDTASRALLGLTVGCARCHDHKFDPIPTKDYYALAGIFRSTELLNGYGNRVGGNHQISADRLIQLDPGARAATGPAAAPKPGALRQAKVRLGRLRAQVKSAERAVGNAQKDSSLRGPQRRRRLTELRTELAESKRRLRQAQQAARQQAAVKVEGPVCLGVRDGDRIVDCAVNIRGDAHRLGETVPRGFLQGMGATRVSPLPSDRSGRLELARWIASPDNPLTARVMVNRIWHHLFGQGLVRTVDNFGRMGARPTHPDLLDYLARQFVRQGWSVKQAIRAMVLSRTYQLGSDFHARNFAADGDNQWLWRMNRKRLEFEAIRDSILAVSGQLQLTRPEASPVAEWPLGEIRPARELHDLAASTHRSVYLPIVRNALPEAMSDFDFPTPSEPRGARDVTTVPAQALFLLNSPLVIEAAGQCAKRLAEQKLPSHRKRAAWVYRLVLGRSPTDSESRRVVDFVRRERERPDVGTPAARRARTDGRPEPARDPWSDVCHALLASAEFFTCP
jgi:hypothetical protein